MTQRVFSLVIVVGFLVSASAWVGAQSGNSQLEGVWALQEVSGNPDDPVNNPTGLLILSGNHISGQANLPCDGWGWRGLALRVGTLRVDEDRRRRLWAGFSAPRAGSAWYRSPWAQALVRPRGGTTYGWVRSPGRRPAPSLQRGSSATGSASIVSSSMTTDLMSLPPTRIVICGLSSFFGDRNPRSPLSI